MAATDARPVPRKNVAYRHYLAIRKNDGSLITTWAGQDTQLSLDGQNFAAANPGEATEIQTSGTGYVDLTAAEMNADCVIVKTTVTNDGALPHVAFLYPEEGGDIRANITQVMSKGQDNVIIHGTVETDSFVPTTTEFEASDITEATEDHYKGAVICFRTGALAGQRCAIVSYEKVGSYGHFTVSALTEAPGDGDEFSIY